MCLTYKTEIKYKELGHQLKKTIKTDRRRTEMQINVNKTEQ